MTLKRAAQLIGLGVLALLVWRVAWAWIEFLTRMPGWH